ncbi:hypothetical protein HYALB_00003915 [Hymenoscyphus albidus]|uniref:FAD-binding PCMH-type domain-containing protein n=1 Tax=Hymenoscyphus albidus TaxID=595503 RepID=A0A9N9LQY2_9HELO|nr:hypothetical protein HYALB_00003915 [Hymenoscyphus albidus]
MLISTFLVGALHLGSCLGRPQTRRDEVVPVVESSIADFVESLQLPADTAELITNTLTSNDEVIVLLSNATSEVEKRSLKSSSKLAPVACDILQKCLGNAVVQASSRALIEVNWSQECWLTPQCIISPASSRDVSVAIKTVGFLNTRFAVRSGGHSPNPGFSSIGPEGILIELSRLNQVTLSADKKVASVGPGLRWGDVYKALDASGVTAIGGRIPSVGVGGLILSGGISHFSAQFGLAADNVENFEIVLADGSVANANAQSNADLFWSLKGGGPNFGIVTKYDLYTAPVKNIWYTARVHLASDVPALLAAFVQYQNEGALDEKTSVLFQIGLDTVTVGLVYSENARQPAAFDPFFRIAPLVLFVPPTNGTVVSFTDVLGAVFGDADQPHDYRGASSLVDLALYTEVETFWRTQASAVRAATGANMTFTMQHMPQSVVTKGTARGGNALGMVNKPQQWWTTVVDWSSASQDAAVRDPVIAVGEKWKSAGQARGSYVPLIYMGDGSRDQNPLASYGTENLNKLKATAKKYDPRELFQTMQQSGFLLSKA